MKVHNTMTTGEQNKKLVAWKLKCKLYEKINICIMQREKYDVDTYHIKISFKFPRTYHCKSEKFL